MVIFGLLYVWACHISGELSAFLGGINDDAICSNSPNIVIRTMIDI